MQETTPIIFHSFFRNLYKRPMHYGRQMMVAMQPFKTKFTCKNCGKTKCYDGSIPNNKGFCSLPCQRKYERTHCVQCGKLLKPEEIAICPFKPRPRKGKCTVTKAICQECKDKYKDNKYYRRWAQHKWDALREWARKNPEKARACRKRYEQSPKGRARQKRYRNSPKFRAYRRNYYLKNRERILAQMKERYRRKKGDSSNTDLN